jgi:hypothetical protein
MSVSTEEKVSLEMTSDCTCTNEDETPSSDCFGCWDDAKWLFKDLMNDWRKATGVKWDSVRIDGYSMGWQRRSGEKVVPFERVLDTLTINGDFRLEFFKEGSSLKAFRYSHDEPTGAKFVFTLVEDEEED